MGSAIGPVRTQLRDVEEQVTGLKDTLSAAQNTITSLDMAQKKTTDSISSQDAAIDALKVTTQATDVTVADIAGIYFHISLALLLTLELYRKLNAS